MACFVDDKKASPMPTQVSQVSLLLLLLHLRAELGANGTVWINTPFSALTISYTH